MCAPHVETATGIILPDAYIAAVAEATHEVGGLFCLDSIASGNVWVDMKATGVDVLISAPQKGWSGPACVGIVMLGERARQTARRTPVALPGERFVTPVALPAPWRFRRFYFLLGRPIPTDGVDASDAAACLDLHDAVKAEIEASLRYLLEQRKSDPYEALLPRLAFEASWEWERQAPSFELPRQVQ